MAAVVFSRRSTRNEMSADQNHVVAIATLFSTDVGRISQPAGRDLLIQSTAFAITNFVSCKITTQNNLHIY